MLLLPCTDTQYARHGNRSLLPNSKGGMYADFNDVGCCSVRNDLKGNIASRAEAEAYMARLRQFWERHGEQIEAIVADKPYLFRQRKYGA